MKLYLCRHGRTFLNQQSRWQGSFDSPLTEKGKEQAKGNAEYLKGRGIDAIFYSPLGRARQTASYLRKRYPKALFSEEKRLREINNGVAEGRSFKWTKKRYSKVLGPSGRRFFHTRFPEGESYEDAFGRIKPFIKRIQKTCKGKTVAIVAHGGTNRLIMGYLLSMPGEEILKIDVPNGMIYEVDLDGEEPKVFHIRKGHRGKGLVWIH